LSTLLYGANTNTEDDTASAGGLLDLDKLQELSKGFESYTTSTTKKNDNNNNNKLDNTATTSALEPLVDVLLNEDRNFLQDALLKEAAMTFDAALRDTVLKTLPPIPASSLLPLPPNILLRPLHLAQTTLALDDRDEKRLKVMNTLLSKLASGTTSSSSSSTTTTAAINNVLRNANSNRNNIISLAQEASRRRNALARISLRLGESMATVQATRLRDQSSSLVRAATTTTTTTPPLERIEQEQQRLLAERLEGLAQIMGQLDSALGS